jgi:hypothetical protein
MNITLIFIVLIFAIIVYLLSFHKEFYVPFYIPRFVPKPGKWFREYQAICAAYYPKHSRLPRQQQDCYDSSFVFTDNMSRLVKGEGNYPGCAQVTQRTNYCYSNQYGEYVPNYPQLFYDGP